MAKTFRMARFGRQLWSVDTAETIRGLLLQQLDTLEEGETLVVDALNVEVFDFRFAQSLFGRVLLELPVRFPGRFLVIEALAEDARINLDKALQDMDLLAVVRANGGCEVIGKAHPVDQETLQAVAAAADGISPTELRKQLEINLTTMNQRLIKLLKHGILRREQCLSPSGRVQYRYFTAKDGRAPVESTP